MPRQELSIIQTFLGQVRGYQRRRRVIEASVWGIAWSEGWLLAVLLLSPWITPSFGVALSFWAFWGGGLATLWYRIVNVDHAATSDLREMARRVEITAPALRNDLVTALQFGAEEPSEHTSQALIDAHLRQTARETTRYRGRLYELIVRADLIHPQQVIFGVGMCLLAGFSMPGLLGQTFQSLSGLQIDEVFQEILPEEETAALVTNLDVTLRFPVHAGGGKQTRHYTSGQIDAPRGTEVSLQAFTTRVAESIRIIYESDEGKNWPATVKLTKRKIEASFVVQESGTYRFELITKDGVLLKNDTPRKVISIADRAPRVTLKLDGKASVSRDAQPRFTITATDDHGLGEVSLLLQPEGIEDRELRTVVATPADLQKYSEPHTLDLAAMELLPGETLIVIAEAVDNDAVLGFKRTRSNPIVLQIEGPEDRHEVLIDKEQELFEVLLLLLADDLEAPILIDGPGQPEDDGFPNKLANDPKVLLPVALSFAQRRGLFMKQFSKVLDGMESELTQRDTLIIRRDHSLLRSLYNRTYSMHRDELLKIERVQHAKRDARSLTPPLLALGRHRIELTTESERLLILLEELIASQLLDAMQATINRIRALKKRLVNLFKEYRKSKDPQLKAEILTEIRRLKRQMDTLRARLDKQTQKMPDEFMNAGSFKEEAGASSEGVGANLGDLESMLEAGDIDGALAALEKMDKELDDMLSMRDEYTAPGGSNAPNSTLSKLDKAADALMDAINDLAAAEVAIEHDSALLRDKVTKRQNFEMETLLEPFFEAQGAHLEKIKEKLQKAKEHKISSKAQSSIASLERDLERLEAVIKERDLEATLPSLRRFNDHSRDARVDLMGEEMELSFRDPKRKNYRDSREDLRAVEEQTQEITDNIQAMLEDAAPRPTTAESTEMKAIGERQEQVSQGTQKLEEMIEEASIEFPIFKEEMTPPLQDAKRFMRKTQRSFDRAEISSSLENERQSLRSIYSMKRQLQKSLEKQRSEREGKGKEKGSSQKLNIPGKDTSDRAFREALLEAMKAPGLPAFEEENTLYYQSLLD